MALELKPVMNKLIHKPITNLEALLSLSSPSVTIQAVKESTEPYLTKSGGLRVEIAKEAKSKSKIKTENSAS